MMEEHRMAASIGAHTAPGWPQRSYLSAHALLPAHKTQGSAPQDSAIADATVPDKIRK